MAIRVLHLTSVETPNYYLNNLVDQLDPDEIQTSAITLGPDRGFASDLRDRGVRVFALGLEAKDVVLKGLSRTSPIIADEQPDIIHGHLFAPSLIGALNACRYGKRFVLTRHHSDALHNLRGHLKRGVYLTAERWMHRVASHIIAPSQAVFDVLTRREHLPASKVSLVPYGQSKQRYESVTPGAVVRVRQSLRMNGERTLVCVCRLHSEKGHRHLFKAFADLQAGEPSARLFLVGVGPEEQALRKLARSSGIAERVHFLGWRDDALAIIAAADLIVHPSLHEALPSAVIEAVMLERPVVATDVSGVRDILGNGAYGEIVPPADSEALGATLREVLLHLPAARERAREGRRYLCRYMDAERVAHEYAVCYHNVVGNRNETH